MPRPSRNMHENRSTSSTGTSTLRRAHPRALRPSSGPRSFTRPACAAPRGRKCRRPRSTRTSRNTRSTTIVRSAGHRHSMSDRQASADARNCAHRRAAGTLDVVSANADHMSFGPAEAFTPTKTIADSTTVNVLAPSASNVAALRPACAKQARGLALVLFPQRSSAPGGTPRLTSRPTLPRRPALDCGWRWSYALRSPDALGHRPSIIVPGAFTGRHQPTFAPIRASRADRPAPIAEY